MTLRPPAPRSLLTGSVRLTLLLASLVFLGNTTNCDDEGPECVVSDDCTGIYDVCVDCRCVECLVNADCPAGEACGLNLFCAPACSDDTDCDPDETCSLNSNLALGDRGPTSVFTDSGQELGTASSSAVAVVDIDRDGDPDAVAVGFSGNDVWLNDEASGTFVGGSAFGAGRARDVASFSRGSLSVLALANESGGADPGGQVWAVNLLAAVQLGSAGARSVAVGDVDGDGREDVVLGHDEQAVFEGAASMTVWTALPNFGFASPRPLGVGSPLATLSIALGDVDGDGDLDVFAGHATTDFGPPPGVSGNAVWINQGGAQGGTEGDFVDSGQSLGDAYSQGVALVDLDGDDDLDAVVANGFPFAGPCRDGEADARIDRGLFTDGANRVWINQGGDQAGVQGEFASNGQALGAENTSDATVVSFAGTAGVLFSNLETDPELWASDGAGSLVFVESIPHEGTFGAAAADLDGDSDQDLFLATTAQCPGDSDADAVFAQVGGALGTCIECRTNDECSPGQTCLFGRCQTPDPRNGIRLTDGGTTARGDTFGNGALPEIDSDGFEAGDSSAHTVSFGTAVGDLETFAVDVQFPFAYAWNEFSLLGPVGTEVGRVRLEQGGDVFLEGPLITYDSGRAFFDMNGDGSPVGDITLTRQQTSDHRLVATFPFGDLDPGTLTNATETTVTLDLEAGIVRNPLDPGTYPIRLRLVSVDPDTDDDDDGSGDPPLELVRDVSATIVISGVFTDGFESGDTSRW